MLTAQQAATGATICIASAIRTIGRKFRNRRRIDHSTSFERYQLITRTNHCRGWTASRCPALHVFAQSEQVIPRHEIRLVLPPDHQNIFGLVLRESSTRMRLMQFGVVKSRSLRKLREI